MSRGRNDESQRYEKIPENLQTSLMEFQRIGVKFALKKGTRVLIGDEMGLGKTVQAIALLSAYKDKWPAIIITPASLRGKTPICMSKNRESRDYRLISGPKFWSYSDFLNAKFQD